LKTQKSSSEAQVGTTSSLGTSLCHGVLVATLLLGLHLVPVVPSAFAGTPAPQAVVELADGALSDLGSDPIIVEAVRAENQQRKTLDQIKILDEGWRSTTGVPEFMRGWIDSDCGRHLQEIQASAPYYTLLWASDDQGANVAMTGRVPAYWHGEEPCFKRAMGGGTGAVYVGEVETGDNGRSVVEVCIPVVGHGIAIGVLHAVIDVSSFED
jgi:hypothetical protein